ncbi:MAG: 2Fe-2S iron-sulfur cluster-binding protein [Bacteroidota bacterium]
MIKLTIDNSPVEVEEGTTVMQAAAALGIEIPAMCYLEGHSCHPSCMVCMVKDADRGNFFPSCAMPVSEGMNITATSLEVSGIRREALELLLSDHVGDCEAPCTLSCPAGMDIPLMNRLIAKGEFDKSLEVVHNEIALPLILGYICPAPCEKACRRKPIGGAVSICLLKRFTARDMERRNRNLQTGIAKTGKKIAILGTGPAGLSAAYYLLKAGHDCVLFDKNELAGGAMRYSISVDKLPREILDAEIEGIRLMGAVFQLNFAITPLLFENEIIAKFDAVLLATGNRNQQAVEDFGLLVVPGHDIADKKTFKTLRPGVFACGNMIREYEMAVRASAQGRIAATEIGIYLQTQAAKHKIHFNSTFGHLTEPEQQEYLKESVPGTPVEPEGGFMAGFNAGQAMAEAKRCLHCDCRKPASCKLRIYSDQYGVNRKRHLGPERKSLTKSVHHDLVVYEPEKCIRCGLCVEISAGEESLGLTYIGRGFDVRISVPFDETIAEALTKTAAACVNACPTGAMAFKEQEERK